MKYANRLTPNVIQPNFFLKIHRMDLLQLPRKSCCINFVTSPRSPLAYISPETKCWYRSSLYILVDKNSNIVLKKKSINVESELINWHERGTKKNIWVPNSNRTNASRTPGALSTELRELMESKVISSLTLWSVYDKRLALFLVRAAVVISAAVVDQCNISVVVFKSLLLLFLLCYICVVYLLLLLLLLSSSVIFLMLLLLFKK